MNDGNPMLYFGANWRAPALDGAQQVSTPMGERCTLCNETIMDGDRGFLVVTVSPQGWGGSAYIHAECQLLGIVGHDFGVCSCTGHDTTARASAMLLWARMGKGGQLP